MVINEQDYKILWANDWYDGPLSGMALFKDEKCYFFLDDRTFEEETKRHKDYCCTKDCHYNHSKPNIIPYLFSYWRPSKNLRNQICLFLAR